MLETPTMTVSSSTSSSSAVVDDPTAEEEEAVATAAALVGENVMDSARGINRHQITESRMKAILARYDHADDDDEEGGGSILEKGMKWWQKQRERAQQESLQRQAEEQRRKIVESGVEEVRVGSTSLEHNETFRQMMNVAKPQLQNLFTVSRPRASKSGMGLSVQVSIDDDDSLWVPEAKIIDEPETKSMFQPYLLTKPVRQALAALALPPGIMYCPWTRLYSLARDGDSFFTFLRKVKGFQHSLLVVRTTKGSLFGGYADSPWEVQSQTSPEFFGSAQACLYRIDGDEVKVYKWSGANRYLQFLDSSAKMVAFGGGGGSFGLCVERDFQVGSTDRCVTFENEPLCPDTNFEIVDVECYGFLTGVF
mmetsp:Transcript_22352/g.51547  ORF Transcript_22352/g.51547 Transcript_22352/m.51547 type:complete len:366 (-) Transcript_22352:162-1259(-)